MPESQSLEERLGATKQVTDIVRAKEDADVGGAEHGVTGVEVGAAGVWAKAGQSGEGRRHRFHAYGDEFVSCLEALDDYKCV